MADWHVILRGRAPGAAGLSLPTERREFVLYEVDSAGEAERAALRAARAAGMEDASVVLCLPWTQGRVQPAPNMTPRR